MAKQSKRSPKSSRRSPKSSKRSKRSKASKSPRASPSKHEAYCFRCRKTVKMTGCKLTKSSKGQPMLQGKCAVCGTKVSRIVKKGTKSC